VYTVWIAIRSFGVEAGSSDDVLVVAGLLSNSLLDASANSYERLNTDSSNLWRGTRSSSLPSACLSPTHALMLLSRSLPGSLPKLDLDIPEDRLLALRSDGSQATLQEAFKQMEKKWPGQSVEVGVLMLEETSILVHSSIRPRRTLGITWNLLRESISIRRG
jgi:hypothetical protein